MKILLSHERLQPPLDDPITWILEFSGLHCLVTCEQIAGKWLNIRDEVAWIAWNLGRIESPAALQATSLVTWGD
jgi:hypothetical protein